MEQPKKLRQRWKPGSIIQLDLGDGTYGFGLVLNEPKVGFFDYCIKKEQLPADIEIIKQQEILFRVWVFKWCVTQYWPIIGRMEYDKQLNEYNSRYSFYAGKNKYYIWTVKAEQISATWEQCKGLEQAHVVEYGIVEQRLRDHFAGRPCYFIERNKPDFDRKMSAKEFYAQYDYDFTAYDDD